MQVSYAKDFYIPLRNKDEKEYIEKPEVQKLPKDSTTSWFRNRRHALTAADIDNQIESEQKNVKVCKDCGSYFYQTETEREWFLERNLKAPCRCYTCRKKRKGNTEK